MTAEVSSVEDREDNGARSILVLRQSVALVNQQFVRLTKHGRIANYCAQLLDDVSTCLALVSQGW